jgi:hypothetical protein
LVPKTAFARWSVRVAIPAHRASRIASAARRGPLLRNSAKKFFASARAFDSS